MACSYMKNKIILYSISFLLFFSVMVFADFTLFEEIKTTGTPNIFTNSTTSIQFQINDPLATQPSSATITMVSSNGLTKFETIVGATSGVFFQQKLAGGVMLDLNGALIRIGKDYAGVEFGDTVGDSVTFNGSVASTPNGLNWNSGLWIMPSSVAGTITNNGTGIFSLGNGTFSNVTATALPSQWTTSTNLTFNLIVGSGNGSATVQATNTLFTGYVNAPTNSASIAKNNTLIAANVMTTNLTGARQLLNFSVALTPAVAGTPIARLLVITGSITNTSSLASIPPQTTGTYIIPMTGWASPNDIYVITNLSIGAGATVAVSNTIISSF